jgi:hypothetical protein
MDPNATLHELRLAIARDDRQDSRYYARCLRDWLKRGGFLPTGETRESVAAVLAMALDPYGDAPRGWTMIDAD